MLVNAARMLELVFPDPASRPSLRWVRKHRVKRTIPFIKVGSLIWFDPDQVRTALQRGFTVEARGTR